MKFDCQNRKHKNCVHPGLFELLHKIIRKKDDEKKTQNKKDLNKQKTQKQKTPYKGKRKMINP